MSLFFNKYLTWPLTVRDLPPTLLLVPPSSPVISAASPVFRGQDKPIQAPYIPSLGAGNAQVPSSITWGLCAALPLCCPPVPGLTLASPPLPPSRIPLRWLPLLFQGLWLYLAGSSGKKQPRSEVEALLLISPSAPICLTAPRQGYSREHLI